MRLFAEKRACFASDPRHQKSTREKEKKRRSDLNRRQEKRVPLLRPGSKEAFAPITERTVWGKGGGEVKYTGYWLDSKARKRDDERKGCQELLSKHQT